MFCVNVERIRGKKYNIQGKNIWYIYDYLNWLYSTHANGVYISMLVMLIVHLMLSILYNDDLLYFILFETVHNCTQPQRANSHN